MRTARSGLGSQSLQCLTIAMREARALRLDPSLELRGVRKIEAVEEGAGIQSHRALQLPPLERVLELSRLGDEEFGIEAELVAPRDRVGAEGLADAVEGLGEGAAGAVFLAVAPEQAGQLRPAYPPRPPRGDDREAMTARRARERRWAAPPGPGPAGPTRARPPNSLSV